METIDSLESLLLHEIKDLYYAEKQIVKALPKVIKKASSPQLKNAIEHHLRETEGHVARLEQVFEILGQSPKAVKCEGMEGILDEAETTIKHCDSPETLDAAIIASAQKVEHYEIANYGSVVEWASILGRQDIKTLLSQTLQEEKKTDQKLTELATSGINQQSARKQKLAA
jgi:ferritin-like metal-binding protein YciE